MTTRVMLLTQWFDPEPTFKGLQFARALVEQGFDVEVVTGFPNYPGGRLYEGFKMKLIQREIIDGVKVTRVPLYPSHGRSAIGRVANYLSFAASSLFYGLLMARRPDVIYAYHPPLTTGITAVLIKLFRRVPIVYDVQDMWPDTLRATGMLNNPRVLNIVGKVCDWVYRRVDRIAVLSPGFRTLLQERGVADAKVELIYNWCAESDIMNSAEQGPRRYTRPNHFNLLFAGNMGRAQALDTVLDAAAILQERAAAVTIHLLGGGLEVQRLKDKAREMHLENVNFLPAVPMAEVGPFLIEADALLVHLRADPLFRITIPSKTQAYMAVGRPLLMAVDGDAAMLVTESGCGVTAKSQDAVALADAACDLSQRSAAQRQQMAANGKTYYLEHLSMAQGVGRFADLFRELAGVPVSGK